MLTRLSIKNFKSIGDPGIDVPLTPLTLFVGPNGAGKSSALEAVALASQRFQNDGPLVSFSSLNEVLHKKGDGAEAVVQLELPPVSSDGSVHDHAGLRYSFQPPQGAWLEFIPAGASRTATDGGHLRSAVESEAESKFFTHVYFLRSVRALRRGPSEPRRSSWVGANGEDTLHILNILNKGEHKAKKRLVQEWALRFGIQDISGFTEGAALDADYVDPTLAANLPFRLASDGSAQALPIVVQLFWMPQDDILLVEEPEASLHPQAQAEMARLLATAASQGRQVLATTHSTFLLMGLTSAVQEQIIRPEDIVIYELEKRAKGTTVKKRIDLNKKGALKGWVSSFSAIERKLMRDWSETLPKV